MTLPWYLRDKDRCPGLWVSKVGYVLFIEKQSDSEILLVSFAPSKEAGPIERPFGENKATIRMPAEYIDEFNSLVVRLAHPQTEPSLHLTPEEIGPYGDGPCLMPSLSRYRFEYEKLDLSWIAHLDPYWLVQGDQVRDTFALVRYIRDLND